jgi:hypothetical protein
MRLTILFILISMQLNAQYIGSLDTVVMRFNDTVYVDCNYSGTESGTIDEPYNNLSDFSKLSDRLVMVRAGCDFSSYAVNYISADEYQYIEWRRWGEGAKPRIRDFEVNNGHRVKISNFILGGTSTSDYALRGVEYNETPSYLMMDSCEVYYCSFGLDIHGYGDHIRNTIVSYVDLDNIILTGTDKILIEGCLLDSCNLGWHPVDNPQSGGDVIQALPYSGDTLRDVIIYNNILDHSLSANKFNIISSGYNDGWIIDGNLMYGPLLTDPLERGAHLHIGGDTNIIVRNNIFKNSRGGYYSVSRNTQIYNNVFDSCITAISLSTATGQIYNNTFYNCGTAISGGNANSVVENNAHILISTDQTIYTVSFNTVRNNYSNLSFQGQTSGITVNSDLGITDAARRDFTITENSILRNNGYENGLTTDILGNSRNLIDVGAFEYFVEPTEPIQLKRSITPMFINGKMVMVNGRPIK